MGRHRSEQTNERSATRTARFGPAVAMAGAVTVLVVAGSLVGRSAAETSQGTERFAAPPTVSDTPSSSTEQSAVERPVTVTVTVTGSVAAWSQRADRNRIPLPSAPPRDELPEDPPGDAPLDPVPTSGTTVGTPAPTTSSTSSSASVPTTGLPSTTQTSPAPTTEPSTTAPSTTAPSTTAPSTTAPSTTEPTSTEPSSTEPSSTEPSSTEPSSTEPSSTEPSSTEPSSTEPSTTEPPSTDPTTTEPSTTEPSTTEPSPDPTTTAPPTSSTTSPPATSTPTTTPKPTTTTPKPTTTTPKPTTTTPKPTTTPPPTTSPGRTVKVGTLVVTTPGTVIDNMEIRGRLIIQAPNVTVQNSLISGPVDPASAGRGGIVQNTGGFANFVLKNSTVKESTRSSNNGECVVGSNFTLDTVTVEGCIDNVQIRGSNVTIRNSTLKNTVKYASDPVQGGGPSHSDNIQVLQGDNILIENNTITGSQNFAVLAASEKGSMQNLRVRNNDVDGGAWTMKFSNKTTIGILSTASVQLQNNRFGGHSTEGVDLIVARGVNFTDQGGNVRTDTGNPVKISWVNSGG